jgi:DegV family protein with EDD domain
MALHIIVDSTANLTYQQLAAQANLHVVPLTVAIGDQEWFENQITTREWFAKIDGSGQPIRTSQPAPGQFVQVLAPLVAAGQQVVVITIAAALSGTWQSAKTATDLVDNQRCKVVDSGTTAAGLGQLALAAGLAAEEGATLEEVVGLVTQMAKNTHTLFVPATLEYLQKGGRIGAAAALVGGVLQIRPVLYLVGGQVAVLDKVRTQPKAITRMVEELAKHPNNEYIEVVHIEAWEEAQQLAARIEQLFPQSKVRVSTGGAVLGSHLGPGLLGIIFQSTAAQRGPANG